MNYWSKLFLVDGVIILITIITLFYVYLKRIYSYWDRKGFKTVPGFVYIFGHLKDCVLGKQSIGDIVKKLYDTTSEPFIGLYWLNRPMLLVRDTELIRAILIKDFAHFTDRGLYCNERDDPLSGHIIALPGSRWKHLRPKLTPTFTSGKLKAMFSTLVECGSTLQNYLDKLANEKELLDVREIAAGYTTNVIASIGFGIGVDCIENPNNEFRQNGRKIFSVDLKNAFRRVMIFSAPKLLKLFRIKAFDPDAEKFIMSVVKQNLEYRENNNVTRKDFFQLLIQLRNTGTVQSDDQWDSVIKSDGNQKALTINEIAAHSFIFFAAGFETSSSTLSFCLYELAKSPEIQDRVHKEIDQALENHNGKLTYESVSEMKYLENCIDETLRKYPIVPILLRVCMENYKIRGTNKIIEKGTVIFIPVYALHRDEKYYPDPTKFNPDRFNEEYSAGKNMACRPYLPFGEGPRGCIAIRLGKLQTKVGLVIMLQHFRYKLEDRLKNRELEMNPRSSLLAPSGGINLVVLKR